MSQPTTATEQLLAQVDDAVRSNKLTSDAAGNLRTWLTAPRYAAYVSQIAEHIEQQKWQALDDAFWTVIPFGTGGRRGRMYPFGSNTINERTIGESAQGLANYVLANRQDGGPLSCAIAYDTRHRSIEFSQLCAEIMVAAGFQVYYLDEHRSTPELSFLVRHKNCACGIMVTASHNPPSDNAVKCYWSTGGQILPPHDKGVIDEVMTVEEITRVPFDEAVADGRIVMCKEEIDAAFLAAVQNQRFTGPRDIRVLYSPLHGVGATAVVPALESDGFEVEVFGPHAEPDGSFPNVPGHVSNPENAAVFDAIIEHGKQSGADVILVTDPDCDRLGCAAPLSLASDSEWATFNGNQIAALLTDYVLQQRAKAGQLTPSHYVVKTLVTTEMVRRIADSYQVATQGDVLVGFKWIAGVMDATGPDQFLFAAEESHGYLVGQYARDKDGVVAAMLMSELCATAKSEGKSLHEKMESLWWQHGLHVERLLNQRMEGSEGMVRMKNLMAKFRTDPPQTLAGIPVQQIRDYSSDTRTVIGDAAYPLNGPSADMIILDLQATGNYVAVRPSGTEPKVKFYMFTYIAPEQLADVELSKSDLNERLNAMESDLKSFAETV